MASKGMEVSLVMVLVTMIWVVGANARLECSIMETLRLAPCLSFVTGHSSTPSYFCCSNLANVVQSNPQCLCSLLNGGGAKLGIKINQTLTLSLPGACNVQTPPVSSCNGVNPPTSSPSPLPSPVTSQVDSPTPSPAEAPATSPSGYNTHSPAASPVEAPATSPSGYNTHSPAASTVEAPATSPSGYNTHSPAASPVEAPATSPSGCNTHSPAASPDEEPETPWVTRPVVTTPVVTTPDVFVTTPNVSHGCQFLPVIGLYIVSMFMLHL